MFVNNYSSTEDLKESSTSFEFLSMANNGQVEYAFFL